MRTVLAWADKGVNRLDLGKQQSPAYAVAFSKDGQQVIVASGNKVLVYDAGDGNLIHTLPGHKGPVYCLSCSSDGKRFASGGADSTVIIWTSKLEGILKYTHTDSIQCLAYNPVTQQLCSCTSTDFGIWAPEQRNVGKSRVNSKILSCSWTNNGQFLAIGMENGTISIRDGKEGQDKVHIERPGAVWGLAWNPVGEDGVDILAVADWGQKLSFYQLSGRMIMEKNLGFDPTCIDYFDNGEFLCIGGSDKKVTLWSKHGVYLSEIAQKKHWIWSCAARPKEKFVAVGDNSGVICMHHLVFNTIHSLYKDMYAYRDLMTDVILQHLTAEKKYRIRCKDCISKIAIYKDRLAVRLPNQVVVYELSLDDKTEEIQPKIVSRIQKRIECFLLVVTSNHIVLCQEKTLQLFNLRGSKEREWSLESIIRFIKVVGGPVGREGLAVGLKNGHVLKVFIDNPFPIFLVKQDAAIRCLDLSSCRKKLAVVDENNILNVYDLRTKEILFTENDVSSVAWNSELEDMLCYSGNGMLHIKAGMFPSHQQKLQGVVVGFNGSKIFCLHVYVMLVIDLPQSASLYRYLETKDFENAFIIACLGVTHNDWRTLAVEALRGLCFPIARKAFIRVRDLRFIRLIQRIELSRQSGESSDLVLLGDIAAFEGKFKEASDHYVKAGNVKKAVDMYTDLKMWDEAKAVAGHAITITPAPAAEAAAVAKPPPRPRGDVDLTNLMRDQAMAQEADRDWRSATNIYIQIGDFVRAVEIYGERGMMEELYNLTKEFDKKEVAALRRASQYFLRAGKSQYASEMFLKMGDFKSLIQLYVSGDRWDDAMNLLKAHPQYGDLVYFPYANWLAVNDHFEKAQEVLIMAGKAEEALVILEQLTTNAVQQQRFDDAGHYYWILSSSHLRILPSSPGEEWNDRDKNYFRLHQKYARLAELYFAYQFVHDYTVLPFTTLHSENIFHISRWLLNSLSLDENIPGIKRINIYYALAKQSVKLGAFKLARLAYDRLLQMRLPETWVDEVEFGALTIRGKPFTDKEDLQPICYRCSTTNPLTSKHGTKCATCSHEFVHSYYSFEVLPLVNFVLKEGICDEEAEHLLNTEPVFDRPAETVHTDGGMQSQLLRVEEDIDEIDVFGQLLERYEQGDERGPIVASRSVLKALHRAEVFILASQSPHVPTRYYKTVVPETPIVLCSACHHFFHEEDYELAAIQQGHCPFCRAAVNF